MIHVASAENRVRITVQSRLDGENRKNWSTSAFSCISPEAIDIFSCNLYREEEFVNTGCPNMSWMEIF